jgi:hypothetical protein
LLPVTNSSSFRENTNFLYIEDVSPDGRNVLVASFSLPSHPTTAYGDLYIINLDGADPIQITNRYFSALFISDLGGAYWTSDGTKIVYIARTSQYSTERAIYLANPDGSEISIITVPDLFPLQLVPSVDNELVYFETGCSFTTWTTSCGYQRIRMDGSGLEEIWGSYFPRSVARESNRILYRDYSFSGYTLADPNLTDPIDIPYMSEPHLSPDGSKLLLRDYLQTESGTSWGMRLWSFPDGNIVDLPTDESDRNFYFPFWSPDSRLIWLGSYILNVETSDIMPLYLPFDIPEAANAFWLP